MPLPGSTLTLDSSRGPIGREVERGRPRRRDFLLSLVLEGGFQESICPVDPVSVCWHCAVVANPGRKTIVRVHSILLDPVPCVGLQRTLSRFLA